MTSFRNGAATCALILCLSTPVKTYAQNLNITVPIGGGGTLTVPSLRVVNEEIKKIPGGADVVPAKDFEKTHAVSLKDVLAKTPGVLAQPRYGEESRLSIRGSGLSRSFHLRGIRLLQDGVPITFADGSGDFQEIDPLTIRHAEIYRGGNGLRYGAANLGGAVNLVTPTAYDTNYHALFRAEGGSDKTLRLHAQAADVFENADIFTAATSAVSSGPRFHGEQNNRRVSGNAGFKLGHSGETRFYLSFNDLEQEVPGTISREDALNNPKRVPVVNITNDYARDIRSLRIANKTVFLLDNGWKVEGGVYANDKFLYHPIFQVIDQNLLDLGTFAKLDGFYALAGHRNEFTAGLNLGRGVNDAERYVNNRGRRGALTARSEQVAGNIELYGENRLYLTDRWIASAGFQAAFSSRDYDDKLNSANDDQKNYRSFNPKFGLMYKLNPDSELYAGLTKSSEAPTFSELVQGAIPGFVPVDLQTAWTAEIGTRGAKGDFSWDATLYHARLKNELLNFTVTPDVPASTFNADDTVHQGLELALGWKPHQNLSFHTVYNYNDFFFRNDEQYGDNDLAGAPPHQARFSARFEKDGYFIEPNIEWTPEAAWVDYANTLKADESAIIGVKAGWDIRKNISLFFDARNLTDEKTIGAFSTVTDARTAGTNVFYPGEGRSLYGGIIVKF